MHEFKIRPAAAADLGAVRDIYNYYVANSTCTYALDPESEEDRRRWFESRSPLHPVIVAEDAGEVIGWASLSPWNSRCGYAQTVEASVYIRHDRHRKGVGRSLLTELIRLAKELGHHTIIGGACMSQTASLALQESLGFRPVGTLRQVGKKFGRWLDVTWSQLMLQDERPSAK